MAILFDLAIGDPRWMPHPVRGIGLLCVMFENLFRSIFKKQRFAGAVTFCSMLIVVGCGTALFLYFLGKYSPVIQNIFSIYLLYSYIAVKDLLVHSNNVYKSLYPQENIEAARVKVGYIVGRDTKCLNSEGVCKACVETVAENMVDGITAPLFYAIVFSLFSSFFHIDPLAMAAIGITFYKTVNTMDSMFGYKNEKYLHFGNFAARFDDLVNYIPARISGFFVVFGALVVGADWKNSYKTLRRDRLNHTSPNAGHTEAAMAGALGVQLGGASMYFGKEVIKPVMGDANISIVPKHIIKTNKIVLVSSAFFIIISMFLRKIFELFMQ